jgi:hypothetical protein
VYNCNCPFFFHQTVNVSSVVTLEEKKAAARLKNQIEYIIGPTRATCKPENYRASPSSLTTFIGCHCPATTLPKFISYYFKSIFFFVSRKSPYAQSLY